MHADRSIAVYTPAANNLQTVGRAVVGRAVYTQLCPQPEQFLAHNPLQEPFTSCSRTAHDMLTTCSRHAHDMFTTCSRHAHDPLMTCS